MKMTSFSSKISLFIIGLLYSLPNMSYAGTLNEGGPSWGDVSETMTSVTHAFGRFLMAGAFCIGLGFSLSAVLKFKYHRDNPTAIPMSVPVLHMLFGIILMLLALFFVYSSVYVYGAQGGSLSVFDSLLGTA